MSELIDRLLRPGRSGDAEIRIDLFWLLGLGLLLIATGIGLRDPWPADEPRFALIARDMIASGKWLIPQVGGDIYSDKPPVFFWLIGLFTLLTGSLRAAFLLPSLLAGLGCLLLVYDLARRLWNREVGLAAGLALLLTLQFVWQARQAQIDALLCFWTTLGLYGFVRHLLLGPSWRWYAIGWAAAGLGIITKGVGFLPILLFIPYLLLRGPRWQPRRAAGPAGAWLMGPLVMCLAISLWLLPMLLAARGSPEIAQYRDEILFQQTVTRYANAWHHREPFWYFIVQVIPGLWLPLTALLPWLWGRWRASWREGDLRVVLPLAWVLLVVLFFSLSSGKRGVYVLPAVPAFVLACAPFLPDLARQRGPRRVLFALACAIAGITLAGAVYMLVAEGERQKLIASYDIDVVGPLLAIGLSAALACVLTGARRGFVAFAAVLAVSLGVVSAWINPVMNEARSGEQFMRRVQRLAADATELGLVGYKEQYLLYVTRPIVNFGHRRWQEYEQEVADAAAWLAERPGRMLLVEEEARQMCFADATTLDAGMANRQRWFLVTGQAVPSCVAKGNLSAARTYSKTDVSAALTPPSSDVSSE
jgi:4-amino-4-deoxy-L-arabinose transferase-like glycosyltransferase